MNSRYECTFEEGSRGLEADQGHVKYPWAAETEDVRDQAHDKDLKEQGSHANFKS